MVSSNLLLFFKDGLEISLNRVAHEFKKAQ